MGFNLRDNPCWTNGQDCSERHVGCHGNCQKWKEWQEGYLKLKKAEAEERRTKAAIKDVREKKKGAHTDNSFRNKSKIYRIVHDNKIGE